MAVLPRGTGSRDAVALATRSHLAHMGVVFVDRGAPWVLEAVAPVKQAPFEAWRRRGEGGRVWVKRLRDASSVLTPAVVARMRATGEAWLGRRYELQFRCDDERLYCSVRKETTRLTVRVQQPRPPCPFPGRQAARARIPAREVFP